MVKRIFFILIMCSLLIVLLGLNNQVKATSINIKGNSVFRKNGTTATINFISDTAGTYYYEVTSTSESPEDIISSGIIGEEINANEVISFSPVNLTSGKKYVHILVKGIENSLSNILKIFLPYDSYYFEDFEAYVLDTYPRNFAIRYNGRGDAYQKVTTALDKSGQNGQVFHLNGAGSWSSDQRVSLTGTTIGNYAFYEADLYIANPASNQVHGITLGQNDVLWTGSILRFAIGKNQLGYGVGDGLNNIGTNPTYTTETWYTLKIFLDYSNRKADIYINDVKINTEQLSAQASYTLNYFGIWTGNTNTDDQVYYDNVKFYSTFSAPSSTVAFHYNGATGENSIASKNVTYGSILGELPNPTKTGYTFDGWYLETDFQTKVDATTEVTKIGDLDLYAKWTPNTYTITYYYNGATGENTNISKEVEYSSTYGTLPTPSKTGAEFDGWYLEENFNTKITLTSTVNITDDQNIYAKWTPITKTITIHISPENKGTTNPTSPITVNYGNNKEIEIFAEAGYKIKKVLVDNVNKTSELVNNKLTLVNITENIEVTIEFELITRSITLGNIVNGTIVSNKMTAVFGETVALTITSNEGYKLKNITIVSEKAEVPVNLSTNNTFIMPNDNVVINAEFELIYTEKTLTEERKEIEVIGNFTEDARLVITKIEIGSKEYQSFITLIDEDKEAIGSYEVTIEGGTYQGELILSFAVDAKYNGHTITIYHKKASGEMEIKTAKVENGEVKIAVDELSPFTLVADINIQNQKDETPRTGFKANYMIEIVIITFSLLIVTLLHNKNTKISS